MSDEAAERRSQEDRRQWLEAARKGKRQLADLLDEWGVSHVPWYADNTREPLRDETFRVWAQLGAIVRDQSAQTTSSKPQWSLAGDFAKLFEPDLTGDDLREAIDDWQDDHLGTIGRARVAVARQLAAPDEEVTVVLPGGATRSLAPGGSSLILKGVLEQLASQLLRRPAVLLISESRQHLHVVDAKLLTDLGIEADPSRLLPDALLFDAEPGLFWFVEAVFTDGPIDDGRKAALESWAAGQGIPSDSCRYLTAFLGRTAPPFKRLVASLAWGSYVWFLDEPDRLMRLDDVVGRDI